MHIIDVFFTVAMHVIVIRYKRALTSYTYVTRPAKINHASAEKSSIFPCALS